MKVFVPFSEALSLQLIETLELSSADLVPFQLDYQCVQVELGEASRGEPEPALEVGA